MCIQAERRVPGSADQIIARQPAWMRAELRRLVGLADSLDAVAANAVMSEDFRVAARARLMRRIAPDLNLDAPEALGDDERDPAHTNPPWLASLPSRNGHHPPRRRRSKWLWRGGLGGLFAAALITGATLTASASALPGEPLYGLKQAREELGVRLAPDEDARALALLNQADARLEETTRLLQQGRTDEVAQATQRYDDALDRATTTYVVTIAEAQTDPTTDTIESRLSQQQEQLQMLLASAPEPARADLHEALVATERSRALMVDPRPADTRANRPRQGVAAPTSAAEVAPTSTPPASETPRPADVVADSTPPPGLARVADRHDDDRHDDGDHGAQQDQPTAILARAPESASPERPAGTDSRRHSGSGSSGSNAQEAAVATESASPADDGDTDGDQTAQAVQPSGHDDGRQTSLAAGFGRVADARPQDAARADAPEQNQGSGRGHVADPPPTSPPPVVAQHQSSNDNPRPQVTTSQATTAPNMQSSPLDSAPRSSGSRDGGDSQRPTTPAPATTAHTWTNANAPESRGDAESTRGQSGGARTGTSTAGASGAQSNTAAQSGSGTHGGFAGLSGGGAIQSSGGGGQTSGGSQSGGGGSQSAGGGSQSGLGGQSGGGAQSGGSAGLSGLGGQSAGGQSAGGQSAGGGSQSAGGGSQSGLGGQSGGGGGSQSRDGGGGSRFGGGR